MQNHCNLIHGCSPFPLGKGQEDKGAQERKMANRSQIESAMFGREHMDDLI